LFKHLDQGAIATGTSNYTGYHRHYDPYDGFETAILPLGKADQVYGIDYIEERQSVDKYSKYHGR
jgi:hypothetical protein